MRERFLNLLFDEMENDDSIFFLTADMGINLVERFEVAYPNRFLNVGIAEQNLIGVAAGLAESGMRPFVYTISNFLVQRCFEQIRNDVALHKLPVTLLGTSTGFDNAALGPTHHMVDDWSSIANLPNFKVFSPYDIPSVEITWDEVQSRRQPSYVRLPKGKGVELSLSNGQSAESRKIVLSYGSAATFAQKYAMEKGFRFVAIHELGRSLFSSLDKLLQVSSEVIVIEDQFACAGMYSYLCQWKNEGNHLTLVNSIAPLDYQFEVGLQIEDFMPKETKLTSR